MLPDDHESKVLIWLNKGRSLSEEQARQMFGCKRLAPIIEHLRKKGYPVEDGRPHGEFIYFMRGYEPAMVEDLPLFRPRTGERVYFIRGATRSRSDTARTRTRASRTCKQVRR